jgi:hypothetical protein
MIKVTAISAAAALVAGVSVCALFAQGAAAPAPAPSVTPPPAVAAAFKTAYPKAVISHVSHETEDGVEQYEIESTNQGKSLDVNYKPDGTVLVVEEQVSATDVPAAVTAAITKRYPTATITTRERATEGAKVYFELGLKGASVKEVQLTPDGHWISPKAPK